MGQFKAVINLLYKPDGKGGKKINNKYRMILIEKFLEKI